MKMRTIVLKILGSAMEYIRTCIDKVETEVGGAARVDDTPNGLVIRDPVALPQHVGAGHCNFGTALSEWLEGWAGEDAVCEAPAHRLSFCLWHSHAGMTTYFSGQDEEWIENYVGRGMLVSIVGNHKKTWDHRVDTLIETPSGMLQVKIPSRFETMHTAYADEVTRALADIKANVTTGRGEHDSMRHVHKVTGKGNVLTATSQLLKSAKQTLLYDPLEERARRSSIEYAQALSFSKGFVYVHSRHGITCCYGLCKPTNDMIIAEWPMAKPRLRTLIKEGASIARSHPGKTKQWKIVSAIMPTAAKRDEDLALRGIVG